MDRFSLCLRFFLALIFSSRANIVLALTANPSIITNLYEDLATNHRSIDLFNLSLFHLQSPTCPTACQLLWSKNAARSLIQIGDYDGAITYLRYGLKLAEPQQAIANKELLAYVALMKNDNPLWIQNGVVFSEARRLVMEGTSGIHAYLPENRRQLLHLSTHPDLPAEQQQQIIRYAKTEQTSPWLTGGLSTVIPGSGMFLLSMNTSAAQSFFLTAVSAWAASDLYGKRLKGAGFAAALIASVFYVGGIQATVRSTNEINLSQAAEERASLMKWALPALEFEWEKAF